MADERQKLVEKLDKDLENFVTGLKKRTVDTDIPLEKLEKDLKDHPLFIKELPEDGQLPPLVEALQSLKYDPDENSSEDLARSYKDDGNYNFKLKKYKRAVESYTEGLKLNCGIDELNVQLLTNRAAASYYLGNFRKSLQDCESALKIKPTHMKALLRSAQNCYYLELHEEALRYIEEGFKLEPKHNELMQLKVKVDQGKKLKERNKRKAANQGKKKQAENVALLKSIQERGICLEEMNSFLQGDPAESELNLSFLDPCHPAATSRVKLDETGALVWPVIFLYPEYGETDFIQAFHENDKFIEHLKVMFNCEGGFLPWDQNEEYVLESLKLYYEDVSNNALISVDHHSTLLNVLKDKRCQISGGVPAFIVLVEGSVFQEHFLKNFK